MSYQWHPEFWRAWLKQAPVLCVDAVIFNDNNEVLLVKRATEPFEGFWHLPGVIIRKGESLALALKRVIALEVGLKKFKVIKQVGIFDDPQRDPRGHFITVAFRVSTSEKVKEFNSQQEEIKFFQQLPTKLGFDAQKIIKQAKK